jgi:hypothetical protein
VLGDRLRLGHGLVEAPPPQARAVERHRHDHVGLGQKLRCGASHHAPECGSEVQAVAVFEPMHQRPGGVVVERRGAGAAEHGRIGNGGRRK